MKCSRRFALAGCARRICRHGRSARNIAWFKHNPWFDAEVVPALRKRVAAALKD